MWGLELMLFGWPHQVWGCVCDPELEEGGVTVPIRSGVPCFLQGCNSPN